ncbi:MAG: hypothetical protein JWP48_665 [Actinoallomurus sp.]|jgi:hypothetical protein|nr:hypothetical protein [Actinoallomurus sp.]
MPLASHSAVTAIPFFVPTIIVVAVIVVVVWRDRRRHPADEDETMGADSERGPAD